MPERLLTQLALALVTAVAANAQNLAIVGGTLVDPSRPSIPNSAIVIRDGRITCAGTRSACPVPSGARIVTLSGKFITPGLIDAHVHYSQTGWVDGRPGAIDLRSELQIGG